MSRVEGTYVAIFKGMLPGSGSILRNVHFWEVPFALMLSLGWGGAHEAEEQDTPSSNRSGANTAHVRQSRPDYGRNFRSKPLKRFRVFPLRPGSAPMLARPRSRTLTWLRPPKHRKRGRGRRREREKKRKRERERERERK